MVLLGSSLSQVGVLTCDSSLIVNVRPYIPVPCRHPWPSYSSIFALPSCFCICYLGVIDRSLSVFMISSTLRIRVSTSSSEDPSSNSRWITQVGILQKNWYSSGSIAEHQVLRDARTGLPDVSIIGLSKLASLIGSCNLSVPTQENYLSRSVPVVYFACCLNMKKLENKQ